MIFQRAKAGQCFPCQQALSQGDGNYQTNINQVLRKYILSHQAPLEELLRKVLREELAEYKAK